MSKPSFWLRITIITENVRWAMSIVVAVAVGLRLWGINHALPFMFHPDEPDYVAISQQIFRTGDLNPHFFNYPSLFFYANALAYVPYFTIGKWLDLFYAPSDILSPITLTMGVTKAPVSSAIILGRALSVGLGVASVVLVFEIARRITKQTWVGFVSGLLMALSQTNVVNNRIIAPDTYLTFCVLVVLFFSYRIYEHKQVSDYLWAGLFVGLAISSKYNGAIVGIVPLTAHLLSESKSGIRLNTFFSRRLLIVPAVAIGAFLATTPYALLDYAEFITDLQYEATHYATGHAGMDGNTLRWYLWYLWITTGPVCLLAALSILYGLYHRLPATMLVAVFPIVYFIVIARFVVRNDRTIMPLTPFLFLLAALFLYQLSQRIKDIDHDQRRLVVFNVFAVLLVLTLGYATYRIMDVQLKATAVDSRITARAWLPENIEAGSRIALEAYSIFVEPEQYDVVPVGSMIDQPPEWYIENDIEYLIFGQGLFGRFYRDPTRFSAQINQYEHFFQRFDLEHEFNDGDYTVLIYRVAP